MKIVHVCCVSMHNSQEQKFNGRNAFVWCNTKFFSNEIYPLYSIVPSQLFLCEWWETSWHVSCYAYATIFFSSTLNVCIFNIDVGLSALYLLPYPDSRVHADHERVVYFCPTSISTCTCTTVRGCIKGADTTYSSTRVVIRPSSNYQFW